jgi:hypothetical protein
MAFVEEDHPRDGGKFTVAGGGPHVKGAEHKADAVDPKKASRQAQGHELAAGKRVAAMKARQLAASKTSDPVQKSEHLARANQHLARAQHHEAEAARLGAEAAKGGVAPSVPHESGKHVGSSRHSSASRHHEKGALGEWVKRTLEKTREGVEKGGDKINEAEQKALEVKLENSRR